MQRALTLIALASLTSTAEAQNVLYETSFDDASGWTLDPANSEGTRWFVDALPAGAPFGAYRSAPSSLNYNDDVEYPGAGLGRTATGPLVDLSVASGGAMLEFWCNNRSAEGGCDLHERLEVNVRNAQGAYLDGLCLFWQDQGGPAPTCPADGWHRHTLALDRAWGQVSIEFETRHDGLFNEAPGWFIDDLRIYEAPPLAFCTAKTNSRGCVPAIAWAGQPSSSAPTPFVVSASDVLNQKVGIFFYGRGGPAAIPFQGGLLCSGSPRRRTPLRSSGGNPPPDDCSGTFSIDFQAWVTGGNDPAVVPGVQVDGQFWYRDALAPFATGLTDAIEFVWQP